MDSAEVREVMQKKFAKGPAKLESNPIAQNAAFVKSGTATSETNVIDLIAQSVNSLQQLQPAVLPGSPISLASTSGPTGNAASFSHISSGPHSSPPPQILASMHWKLKEPPCFFGHSSEDVHTWTSLVRHYLTFMGGSDAQQVAYAMTLLRETAHEWFMGYERRKCNPPRDWAQLCSLLLEQFSSNI